MQHLDEGTIHAWIDGALSSDETARVEAHVASCPDCAAKVAEARGLVAASSRIVSALDVTPGGVLPAFAPRKPRAWWHVGYPMMAVAATAIVAVGTIFTMSQMPTASEGAIGAKEPFSNVASSTPAVASLSQRPADSVLPAPARAPMRKRPAMVADRAERTVEPKVSPTPATQPAPVAPIAAPAPSLGLGSVSIRSAADAFKPATAADSLSRSEARLRVTMDSRRNGQDSIQQQPSRVTAVRNAASAPAAASGGGQGGARGGARTFGSLVQPLPLVAYPNASFVGCYQVSESTDMLPRQFALTTKPGAVNDARTNEVRYVDSTGVTSTPIMDLNWVALPGRAMIRSPRGVILTITRVGDRVEAQSVLGLRTIQVVGCR